MITSDGGCRLLREVEKRTAILQRFAESFTDYRDENRIEHNVLSLVSQRVIALASGYEELNDHDYFARDRMRAVAVETRDPSVLPLTYHKEMICLFFRIVYSNTFRVPVCYGITPEMKRFKGARYENDKGRKRNRNSLSF